MLGLLHPKVVRKMPVFNRNRAQNSDKQKDFGTKENFWESENGYFKL